MSFVSFRRLLPALRGSAERFLREESGQDLMEYALLGITVALSVGVAISLLLPIAGTSYCTSTTRVDSLWVTPDPAAAPPTFPQPCTP
jgi:hypothetical protein